MGIKPSTKGQSSPGTPLLASEVTIHALAHASQDLVTLDLLEMCTGYNLLVGSGTGLPVDFEVRRWLLGA